MTKDDSIGLVLSGGGAKGAFQAGVWKAMCELGLAERVRVISGTSIGALNAAAFATVPNPESTCDFWRNHVEDVATPNLRNLTFDSLIDAAANVLAGKAFPFRGLLDRSALEMLLRNLLPAKWPEGSPSVIVSSLRFSGGMMEEFNKSSYELRRFWIDEEKDPERRLAKLMASAAIPWGFDPVEIDGESHVDGGWDDKGGENVPVSPILENRPDIKTIVVVRCNSEEVEPEPLCAGVTNGIRLVEVRPIRTLKGPFGDMSGFVPNSSFIRTLPVLGSLAKDMEVIDRQLRIWSGTFAFESECAKRFIRQGYNDGLAALRKLKPREKLKW
jgi:NTE family protein